MFNSTEEGFETYSRCRLRINTKLLLGWITNSLKFLSTFVGTKNATPPLGNALSMTLRNWDKGLWDPYLDFWELFFHKNCVKNEREMERISSWDRTVIF